MAGIIGTGDQYRRNAMSGMQRASSLEQARESQNKQLAAQETNQKISTTASGAMIGTMIMPGWGTVIGGALGYLLGEVF